MVDRDTRVRVDEDAEEPPELPDDPSLDDYIVYAALCNPGLRAAFETWKAKLERVVQTETLPDPRLSYTYYIREVETRVGPQEQRLGVAQSFPWFDKLSLRGNVAVEEANAAREQFDARRLLLEYRVKDLYYELCYLAQAIRITEGNIDLLQQIEGVAQAKYRVGSPNHPDLIKVQVELGKLEDRLASLEDLGRPLRAEFNAELNRAEDAPVPWPDPRRIPEASVDEVALVAWLRDGNPELRALGFAVRRDEEALRLAGRDYYPDFTVALDWIDTGKAINPGVPDSGKDPWLASISVNLPVWWAKYRAGEREARARLRASRSMRTDRERTLVAELERVLYRYRDAGRKVSLYRDTLIPKGQESLETITAAYQADRADFLDFIDAQRVLLEFELDFERARSDRAQSLAALERLVGRDVVSEDAKAEDGSEESSRP